MLKFRGAGQGPKALAAEIVAGEIARALGLPVPELVFVKVDAELARAEPDPEIQELIVASVGLNLGVDFLPGSLPYNPAQPPDPELAAAVVWLDALVENVDRTPRNPNLLRWHGNLWLIDHGASLFVHHGTGDPLAVAGRPFPAIRDHVLLPAAGLGGGGRRAARRRSDPAAAAALVPEAWTDGAPYAAHLEARLERAARMGPGGRPCPRVRTSSTRSCASCRGSSAASCSTRASCCSAAA